MSEYPSWNEIILNGVSLKTRQAVSDANMAIFPQKTTIGDYTKDSNPLLSSWIGSDFSGGLGVEEMNEGSDINRYRIATLYPRYPNQLSKGYRVTNLGTSGAVVNFRFLGNFKDQASGNWDAIASFGTTVFAVYTAGGTLTAEPVNSCVNFQGTSANTRIVIPMGASGYALYSNAGVLDNIAADATHPALQAVTVWDNKLIGVDTSGQLWWTTNPGAANTWTSYGATGKLPTDSTALGLVKYFDRQGIPTVFVITQTDIWQFDASGPSLFTVDVNFPPHPHHGLAGARWSGDLYFSVGTGVHRYTGGSLSAVGLDRDHGLPIEYAGYIVGGGLVAGYNALYAFVTAPDLSGYTFTGTAPTATSGVYEFSGSGWHMLWESTTEDIVPHSMGVSRSDGGGEDFVLFWGTKNRVATGGDDSWLRQIDLPISFFNPRQLARVTGKSAPNGYFESSIFDAGMKGYNKLASALDVAIRVMDSAAVLTVKYKVNGASSWTTLGTVTTTGTTSLPFGTLTDGIYPGAVFENIQFRFDLADSTNNGFIMESYALGFVKLMPPSLSWQVDVDLSSGYPDRSPQDILTSLDNILSAGVCVPLIVNNTTKHRVFLSQVRGARNTGPNETAWRTISLLELPQSLGAA